MLNIAATDLYRARSNECLDLESFERLEQRMTIGGVSMTIRPVIHRKLRTAFARNAVQLGRHPHVAGDIV